MLWLAVATVLSGIFDIKYYLHLQVRSAHSAHRPIGTFSFRTARATHLDLPPSAPISQIGKRSTEKLTSTTPRRGLGVKPNSTGEY